MNLMFWKKKPKTAADTGESQTPPDDKTVALDSSVTDTPAQPGLVMRIKSGLAGLTRRFRKAPAPDTEENQARDAHDSPEPVAEDTPVIKSMRTKKRLIIGGAIGLLVLLLAGAGFATWKIFLSQPGQEPAAPATAETSHASQPATHAEIPKVEPAAHAETPQVEIEALKKKNDELQAQIEAMKKEQLSPTTSPETGGNAASASSTGSGEITITGKDPKAAAQALKAAIEEMNAASGSRKPAK